MDGGLQQLCGAWGGLYSFDHSHDCQGSFGGAATPATCRAPSATLASLPGAATSAVPAAVTCDFAALGGMEAKAALAPGTGAQRLHLPRRFASAA